jgi:hypothetical protein
MMWQHPHHAETDERVIHVVAICVRLSVHSLTLRQLEIGNSNICQQHKNESHHAPHKAYGLKNELTLLIYHGKFHDFGPVSFHGKK